VLVYTAIAVSTVKANAAEPLRILPSDTDPRIRGFNLPHSCWLPSGPDRHELLLFLPGTGGRPKEHFRFAETAARFGYHVISLMYPDNMAAQKKCGKSSDPDAHLKFRLAIIRGGDALPHRRIAPYDSIESRLERLLTHLTRLKPDDGWKEFLNGRGGIHWDKIAVSGMSQGGGHAIIIAKYHHVARVLTFGSPKDYNFRLRRPPNGFDSRTATPLERYFTFNHLQDNGHGCTHAQQMETLRQMGLVMLGVADADTTGPDFGHAHVLISNANPKSGGFHGFPLFSGRAVCPVVWKYMLTAPVK